LFELFLKFKNGLFKAAFSSAEKCFVSVVHLISDYFFLELAKFKRCLPNGQHSKYSFDARKTQNEAARVSWGYHDERQVRNKFKFVKLLFDGYFQQ
jgi:hypothetical protein